MSLVRRTLQGVATVGVGQGAGQAMAFVRNIIIARLLGPEQFGVAAAFAMTISLLGMLSDLAIDRLITQAPDGNRREMESTLHSLEVLRGLLMGAVMFAVAAPMARFFSAPEAVWAFQLLALAPVVRGFRHLDPNRFMRKLVFRPVVLMDVMSEAAALALAWPLAVALGSYEVMLWVVLLHSTAYTVTSHVMSRRPYRLAWSGPIVRRAMAFGVPVIASGMLLGAIFHGDKFIVGGAYGKTELGLYAVAYGLTLVPSLVIAKVNVSLTLPLLSSMQQRHDAFCSRYRKVSQTTGALAAVYAAGFITLGPLVVVLLYGPDYAAVAGVVAVLGVRQAVRVLRTGPSLAAMALGETTNLMIANVARAAALGLALLWAMRGYPLVWIAAAGLIGELAGLLSAVAALRLRHAIPARLTLRPTAEATLVTVLVTATMLAIGGVGGPLVSAAVLAVTVLLVVAALGWRLEAQLRDLPVLHRLYAMREGLS